MYAHTVFPFIFSEIISHYVIDSSMVWYFPRPSLNVLQPPLQQLDSEMLAVPFFLVLKIIFDPSFHFPVNCYHYVSREWPAYFQKWLWYVEVCWQLLISLKSSSQAVKGNAESEIVDKVAGCSRNAVRWLLQHVYRQGVLMDYMGIHC